MVFGILTNSVLRLQKLFPHALLNKQSEDAVPSHLLAAMEIVKCEYIMSELRPISYIDMVKWFSRNYTVTTHESRILRTKYV